MRNVLELNGKTEISSLWVDSAVTPSYWNVGSNI